ncbi:MAG: type VI secretion system tip protein VgrG [Limnobacter sp.]|nr:type VI secretion system tip protein VgrG [Limnobacter sp.]
MPKMPKVPSLPQAGAGAAGLGAASSAISNYLPMATAAAAMAPVAKASPAASAFPALAGALTGGQTQDDRMLRIYIDGYGENDFIATRAELHEKLSKAFQYQVNFFSNKLHDLDAEHMVGVKATVLLEQGTPTPRFFNGYITAFANLGRGAENQQTRYRITVEPWLSLLNGVSDCRIFQEKNVKQVFEELFKPIGIAVFDDTGVVGKHAKREFWVQYNESIVNFFHRLCRLEGIGYYFSHMADKHTLHLFDTAERLPNLAAPNPLLIQPETISHRHLVDWSMSKNFVVGNAKQRGYNYNTPNEQLLPAASVEGQAKNTPMISTLSSYRYSEVFDANDDGQDETQRLNQRQSARFGSWVGSGNYLHLAPGHHFTVNRATNNTTFGDSGKLFTLLSTSLTVDQQSHSASATIRAVPKGVIETPVGTQPRISGLQTAFVTGSGVKGTPFTDPEGLGRIKVQFHWDREGQYDANTSCWLRVMNPSSGPGFGLQSTPRIGQEVVVAFENGNPDKPFVLGSLPHGEHASPFGSEQGLRSGIRTRSVDPGDTAETLSGFNEISFLDKHNQEQLFIRAQKNMDELVLNNKSIQVQADETHQVGKNLVISAGESITLQVGESTIHMTGSEIVIKAGKVYIN